MKFDGYPTREEVLEAIDSKWHAKPAIEWVPIEASLDRILAADLTSKMTFPIYRAAKLDGIAFSYAQYLADEQKTENWQLGRDYAYADTGDDFPDGFDTVIMVEKVDFLENGGLHFLEPSIEKGENVADRGSTIKAGDFVSKKQRWIRPTDLAAFALSGNTRIPVYQKLKVAFIPTGSELVPLRSLPKRGQMIDCNSLMVQATLEKFGVEPLIYPIVKDITADLEATLQDALTQADLVLINGGSARGKEDYNAGILERMGEVICHGVKAAPGRPLCLAMIGETPVLNIPGPPVATYFGLDWCVSHIIAHYYGTQVPEKAKVQAKMKNECGGPGLADFLCRMELMKNGDAYEAIFLSPRGGAMGQVLSSNGQRILERGNLGFHHGEMIDVEWIE